jgi:hypothetical protein
MTHNTSVTTTFSEPIEPTSLTTSPFTLVRDGTTTPISATVGLSSDGKKATLTPKIALNSRTTYRATVKGGASVVKDATQNALASDKSWAFKPLGRQSSTPTQGEAVCGLQVPTTLVTAVNNRRVVPATPKEAQHASLAVTNDTLCLECLHRGAGLYGEKVSLRA